MYETEMCRTVGVSVYLCNRLSYHPVNPASSFSAGEDCCAGEDGNIGAGVGNPRRAGKVFPRQLECGSFAKRTAGLLSQGNECSLQTCKTNKLSLNELMFFAKKYRCLISDL